MQLTATVPITVKDRDLIADMLARTEVDYDDEDTYIRVYPVDSEGPTLDFDFDDQGNLVGTEYHA